MPPTSRTAAHRDSQKKRLIIVSNRLPVVLCKEKRGRWKAMSGSGGLVTALAPVLRHRGGLWIGWPGTTEASGKELERVLARFTHDAGFTLKPVAVTAEEKQKYYCGFANEVSWPLFHDFPSRCNFDPSYWSSYQDVNRKFALVIKENLVSGDFIWVHDYHLMNVARELRQLGVKDNLGFFLHIPFPPLDIFLRLPWRFELLRSLMSYDLIGFQTLRDRRNFIQCIRTLIRDIQVQGKGQVLVVRFGNYDVRVGTFPISIDFNEFANLAATSDVADRAWYIHEQLPGVQIILGVDRLDYTKGIIERLEAFRNALSRYPELQERVVLVQVVVPSRPEIPTYDDLKIEIERLVGEINGQFTRSGWVPIHYQFRNLDRSELVAYYRTAEIALVTSFKDGMNLIAKEYCAASLEENCVLILSEFAGAAALLPKGALLVNPHDIEGLADAIYQALKMPQDERQQRMRNLRDSIKKQDIYWWVNSILQAAIEKRLDNFPLIEEYFPQFEIQ
ncbi:MAG: trehalose-6-phosphate synthase [Desulfobacterales bacterium]|nr:MAG: trehalose-6-phosphate synthase [Desulfobacterales bacterium]